MAVKFIWRKIRQILEIVVFKVLKLKIPMAKWEGILQFIKFGIVGLSNTLIGFLIYTITLLGIRAVDIFPSVDIYISQLIMFLLSVAWSFYWNNKYVFSVKDGERKILIPLLKTYASYALTSLVLSELLLHLWVKVFGINEFISPMLSLLITVPVNFIIQKKWAFKG